MDRKVTQLSEEIPSRLQREVKNLESRDSHMWRESLSKQSTMMDNISRLKDQWKVKQMEMAETTVHLQGRLSDHEQRI